MSTDWNKPSTLSKYIDFVDEIKNRDKDCATMFNSEDSTNIPVDAIGWKASNKRFEKYNGTTWAELSSTYNIDVVKLNGQLASYYTDATHITSGILPANVFNNTSHGSRGGGSLHADAVPGGASGFMSGADAEKLQNMGTYGQIFGYILTVDGNNSGLDADLLGGIHSSDYATKEYVQTNDPSASKIGAWISFNGDFSIEEEFTAKDFYNILAITELHGGIYKVHTCDPLSNKHAVVCTGICTDSSGDKDVISAADVATLHKNENFFIVQVDIPDITSESDHSKYTFNEINVIVAGREDC